MWQSLSGAQDQKGPLGEGRIIHWLLTHQPWYQMWTVSSSTNLWTWPLSCLFMGLPQTLTFFRGTWVSNLRFNSSDPDPVLYYYGPKEIHPAQAPSQQLTVACCIPGNKPANCKTSCRPNNSHKPWFQFCWTVTLKAGSSVWGFDKTRFLPPKPSL